MNLQKQSGIAHHFNRHIHETGGHWVPGGESRRTVSGLERSSTKASLSGAQDYLVNVGSMNMSESSRMRAVRIHALKVRALFVLFILLGLASLAAAGYLFAQEQYTIYEGALPVATVVGYFRTVEGVLAVAGIAVRPEDVVRPSLPHRPTPRIEIERAQAVTVRTQAGAHTYFTQQTTIAAFLAEITHAFEPADPIFADGVRLASDALATRPLPRILEIGQFFTITIQDGRQRRTVRTTVATVGAALQEAGITLQSVDSVTPPANTPLEPGMMIQVRRAFEVIIQVDGRAITTRTARDRAQELLADHGLALNGEDYTIPGPERALQPGDIIRVIRVTEDFRVQDAETPFQTIYQASDLLEIDTQTIINPGVTGLKRQRIRVRYENGIPVSETVDGEWIAREPVNAVVGYGTAIVLRTLDTPEGGFEYWRVVKMRVTSYTAASSGKPIEAPDYGITASGLTAQKGVVAVDRSVIPWRSWVYVPGYGVGYVGDTGGGVRGRWIDLGYSEEAFIPWSGYVDVYYLTPVPPIEDINFLLPEILP